MLKLNNILKNTIIGGVFLSMVVPFIISNGLYFPFITGRGFFFRILVEILLFLWIVLIIRDKSYLPKKSPLFLSFSIFIGVVFLANIFGVNREVSFWSNFERMDGFVLLIHIYIYFLILISVLRTERIWNWLLMSSVGAGSIMSIYSIFQLLGLIKISQDGARLDGLFGNAIYLAVYMLINIFIAIYLIYRNRTNKILIGVFGLIAFIQVIVLYFTATRGAVLGLIFGILVSSFVFIFLSKNKRLKNIGIGIIIAMLSIIVILFALRDNSVIKNNHVLNRLTSISLEDKTTLARLTIWSIAWQGFLERPLLGYGQGNFNLIFDSKYNPKIYDQEQWFDRTHNIFFDWLIAAGLLGLVSYLSIFVCVGLILFKSKSFTVFEKSLFSGLLSAYFFQNIFAFDQISSYMLFVIVIGYVYFRNNDHAEEEGAAFIKSASLRKYLSLTLLIMMFIVIYYVNIPAIKASNYLVKAVSFSQDSKGQVKFSYGTADNHLSLFKKSLEQNSFGDSEIRMRLIQDTLRIVQIPSISNDIKIKFVEYSISEMKKQIQENPLDARFYYVTGNALMFLGQYEEGKNLIEKAKELSPKKQSIVLALPIAYLKLGDVNKAIQIAKENYEIETNNDKAWAAYVDTAVSAGNQKLVEQLMNETISTNPKRATQFLSYLISKNPKNLQLRVNLVLVHARAGFMDQAIQEINKAKIEIPEMSSSFDKLLDQLKSGKF